MRKCRRCGDIFRSQYRRAKICFKCNKLADNTALYKRCLMCKDTILLKQQFNICDKCLNREKGRLEICSCCKRKIKLKVKKDKLCQSCYKKKRRKINEARTTKG